MRIFVDEHPVKLVLGRGQSNSIRVFPPGTKPEDQKVDNAIRAFRISADESFDPLYGFEPKTLKDFEDFVLRTLKGRNISASTGLDEEQKEATEAPPFPYEFNTLESLLDDCVNRFISEFARMPFRHRVEHSVHCELFTILNDAFGNLRIQIAGNKQTGLVHKEWPEPKLFGRRTRKGSMDIAVLPPTNETVELEAFQKGLVKPVAGFELGLNYGIEHFEKDLATLRNAELDHSYLIHLTHSEHNQDEVIDMINGLPSDSSTPKIAAVIGTTFQRKVCNK